MCEQTGCQLPNLQQMGLGNILPLASVSEQKKEKLKSESLGIRKTFSDDAKTAALFFNMENRYPGGSFLNDEKKPAI